MLRAGRRVVKGERKRRQKRQLRTKGRMKGGNRFQGKRKEKKKEAVVLVTWKGKGERSKKC